MPHNQIRHFASTPDGRALVINALNEARRSIDRATETLTDLNDASSHGTLAERTLLKTRIHEHMATLRASIHNFEIALAPAGNASMGLGS